MVPGEPCNALALPVNAMSMSVAVRDLALLVSERALLALPAGVAQALAVRVVTVAGAEDWAHAWDNKQDKMSILRRSLNT